MNLQNTAPAATEEETYQKEIQQIKQSIFKLFNYYNKSIQTLPNFIFYILSFIQFLQILWYIVHPNLSLYSQTQVIKYIRAVLQVLNPEYALRIYPDYNFVMIGIVVCILSVLIVLLCISYYFVDKQHKIKFTILRTSGILMLLIQTALFIPIFQIICPIFYCGESSPYYSETFTCYDVNHIIMIIISAIVFIFMIILKIVCFMLLTQRNPLIQTPFIACQSNLSTLGTLAVSLAMIFYYIVDVTLALKFLYILALVMIIGGYIFLFRYDKQGFYNKTYGSFKLCLQFLLFGFSLNNIIKYYLKDNSKKGFGIIQLILSIILLSFAAKQYLAYSADKKLRYVFHEDRNKGKPEQIIFPVISCLIHGKDLKKRQILAKVLIKNSKFYKNSKQQKWNQFIQNRMKPTQKQYLVIVFNYLKLYLQDCIAERSSFLLQTILCAVLYQLNLKSKCLYLAAKLQKKKANLMDQFFIFQIKQKQLLFRELNQKQEVQILRNTLIVKFQRYLDLLADMEIQISQTILSCVQYWNQLIQDDPQFVYLTKVSKKILNHYQKVQKLNSQILLISSSNVKSRFLYYSFLEALEWNHSHSEQKQNFEGLTKYLRNSPQFGKKFINTLDQTKIDIKFQESERLVAIQVDFSTTESTIMNCNSQVTNFLGYTKAQLLGKNVQRIIPKIYVTNHFKFVEAFINREDSFEFSSSKIIYALSKQKFLQPGLLTVKILLSLEKGMNIISFIKPLAIEQDNMTIITEENSTKIQGISKLFKKISNDEELIKSIHSLDAQLEMLFPDINFSSIKQDKQYETLMATENIENQSKQINCKRVILKMQRKAHHSLKIRYYSVEIINQKKKNFPKSLTALGPSREKSREVISNQFVINSQNYEDMSYVQSLSQLKQDFLLGFNSRKYFLGSLLLLILIGCLLFLLIMSFTLQRSYFQKISDESRRMNILNKLSESMANLTIQISTQIQGIQINSFSIQQKLQYQKKLLSNIDVFNKDFDDLVSYLKITQSYNSMYSLNYFLNQPHKVSKLYDFQVQTIKSIGLYSSNNGFSVSPQTIYQRKNLISQLLTSQIILLNTYFDEQFKDMFLVLQKQQNDHQKQVAVYLYSEFGIVLFVSLSLYFIILKSSQNIKTNAKLITNLNTLQVNSIMFRLWDFNHHFFVQSNLQEIFQQTLTTLRSMKNVNLSSCSSLKRIKKPTLKSKFSQSRKLVQTEQQEQQLLGRQQERKSHFSLNINDNENKIKQRPKRISFDDQLADQLGQMIFKEALNIAKSEKNSKKSQTNIHFQSNRKQQQQTKNINQKNTNIKRYRNSPIRNSTIKNRNVTLTYKAYQQKLLLIILIIVLFGGIIYMFYAVDENYQAQEIDNQTIMIQLNKLSIKIMYIKSILRVSFKSLADFNGNIFVNSTEFANQITIIRDYLSQSQPFTGDPVPILKHLYQDVQQINHLTFKTERNSSYKISNDEFLYVEEKLQEHYRQLSIFINNVNADNKELNSTFSLIQNVKIVVLILIRFLIAIYLYLKVVRSTQEDQITTFSMVRMIPISSIHKNEKIIKYLNRQQQVETSEQKKQ